ncbi:MAG TPA: DUF4190 domain-containing protein [Verrucomicrobiae bacterium]|jgi:hypothetical protein
MYKIIGADQKEYGPITADQLRSWISEGRINAQTKVQPFGATDWKSMGELPEFASILPRPAPPLAGPMPISGASIHPHRSVSQLAVWSLVTGIISLLCCQWYIAPVSIVLGAVALSQLKSHPEKSGGGMAIAGIVLGVVALLLGLTFLALFIADPTRFQNLQHSLPQ